VQQYLRDAIGQDEATVSRWVRHWIAEGLGALETLVGRNSGDGRHCFGASVTLADACVVPQLYNARRAGLDLATWPCLAAVASHLESLPEFAAARPEVQPDAPPGGG
jgi:maleylacetoacetate isomerase/maleylpyruvate isomerase